MKKPLKPFVVSQATRYVLQSGQPYSMQLSRGTGFGIGKCKNIIALLVDAGVITSASKITGERKIILKNESAAVNAALRQLKKGKK